MDHLQPKIKLFSQGECSLKLGKRADPVGSDLVPTKSDHYPYDGATNLALCLAVCAPLLTNIGLIIQQ